MTPAEFHLKFKGACELLVQNHPPWFCTIEQDTLSTHKKLDEQGQRCPFVKIRHLSRKLVILGGCYEKQVNRQRLREEKLPDFKVDELWNGQGYHVPGSPCLIGHHGKPDQYYLAYRVQRSLEDLYRVAYPYPEGLWYDASIETVQHWLKESGCNAKQDLDKEVFWRTVKIENITNIGYRSKTSPTSGMEDSMARKSKIVVEQVDFSADVKKYKVTKLTNRLDPPIGTLLKKEELSSLMDYEKEDMTTEIIGKSV